MLEFELVEGGPGREDLGIAGRGAGEAIYYRALAIAGAGARLRKATAARRVGGRTD